MQFNNRIGNLNQVYNEHECLTCNWTSKKKTDEHLVRKWEMENNATHTEQSQIQNNIDWNEDKLGFEFKTCSVF